MGIPRVSPYRHPGWIFLAKSRLWRWRQTRQRSLNDGNLLERLFAGAIADSESRRQELSIEELESIALKVNVDLDALDVLAPADHIHVIAEIKRASPSRGLMANISNVQDLASTYEKAGASAISVLTEEREFLGSLTDLKIARQAVSVPLLRKDFIANEYQILEARAYGANIVLLIKAGLDAKRLVELKNFAEELDLAVLVETHTLDEVEFAVDTGAGLIGINARDLSTFETNMNLFESYAQAIPSGVIKIAESAVRNVDDVRHYRNAGADAVLVGEALVKGDAMSLIQSFVAI